MELIKTFRKYGYTLRLWDTHRTDCYGKSVLRYELKKGREVLFTGADFACSPCHAIDSLDTVASLLSFLTLKPGDTDRDYFKDYTPRQLEWCCSSEAEPLALWVYDFESR